MEHGGPDASGMKTLGPAALFHCRLALLDPSASGAQPMQQEGALLSYNGEIYNYRELRTELEALNEVFTGTSDTEVVLAALRNWGRAALNRFRGMFALAFWDAHRQTLLLARDPLGIKPLYYSRTTEGLLFASELKALRKLPGHSNTINHAALPAYLSRGYIPAPDTIYHGTHKLSAGEWLAFSAATGRVTRGKFYQLENEGRELAADKPEEAFRNHFAQSCRRRLLADVPVGVLLSGGIDSSLIAATVAQQTTEPVRTYTMGFDDPAFDEAPRAAAIARHLKTEHTTFYCGAPDFLAVLPQYADIFDEPFGDASGIATYLLAQGVSADIKCCLGGEGGDELFGGYAKYRATLAYSRYLQPLPAGLRKLAAGVARSGRPDKIAGLLNRLGLLTVNGEEKLYKLSTSLRATSPQDFFRRASTYADEDVLARLGVSAPISARPDWPRGDLLKNMAVTDLQNFVEGDLLVKTDRASMQHGLEVRLPFLDVDLVDFALAQPADWKLKGGQSKILPRALLAKYLPQQLIGGPKKGFTIPLDRWLRTSLTDELQTMAADAAFSERFRLRNGSVAEIVSDYLSGRTYVNAYPVWFLYVLYLWHQRWPV
jgi:asparagine synthase (glutamine-hydrolysing)